MIGKMLAAVRRLDEWLRGMLGRPYHAALGFGLILEIIARLREMYEAPTKTGIVKLVLLLLLYLLLLVHQVGELSEHAERRRGALPDR